MHIKMIRVFGFESALFGMRNPEDSWADSDSTFYEEGVDEWCDGFYDKMRVPEKPNIGVKDMELAKKLIIRGSEHRKFLRQIMVWMNITIPRFVWQELDTYKVATTRMSCSTMNTLGREDLDQSAFERPINELTLEGVNKLGQLLRDAKADKEEKGAVRDARVQLKNDLPEGFLQMATYTMSYETVLAAIMQRRFHRLPQWRKGEEGSIVNCLLELPYMEEFYEAAIWKMRTRRDARKLIDQVIRHMSPGAPKADLERALCMLRRAK